MLLAALAAQSGHERNRTIARWWERGGRTRRHAARERHVTQPHTVEPASGAWAVCGSGENYAKWRGGGVGGGSTRKGKKGTRCVGTIGQEQENRREQRESERREGAQRLQRFGVERCRWGGVAIWEVATQVQRVGWRRGHGVNVATGVDERTVQEAKDGQQHRNGEGAEQQPQGAERLAQGSARAQNPATVLCYGEPFHEGRYSTETKGEQGRRKRLGVAVRKALRSAR